MFEDKVTLSFIFETIFVILFFSAIAIILIKNNKRYKG